MTDQICEPPKKTLAERAELATVFLAIFWIFFTVAASVVRWQQLTGWDYVGNTVGVITGLGYWFRLKPHQIVAQLICFVLLLLFVLMCLMFIPRMMV